MAELAPYRERAADPRRRDAARAQIRVAWDDGTAQRLHPLWLRSECACPACRDRVTLERTFDQFRLPLDLAAATVEVTAAGALRLVWPPDGHVSLFDPGWLHQARAASGPRATGRGTPRLWRAADLAGSDPDLRAPGDHDRAAGAARLAHARCATSASPCSPACRLAEREVERIARRISLPRDSNFGAVFDVMTMANANSNAYTAIELPPHVDLPTREYQPGFQFFHCLDNQAAGRRIRPMSTASRWPSICAPRSPRPSALLERDAARLSLPGSGLRLRLARAGPGRSTSATSCARSASFPG